jgi:hypothetical protein
MRCVLAAALVLATVAVSACEGRPIDPLQLEQGVITVNNRSAGPWTGVEIWINQAFRVTTASIDPAGRFQVPVNSFVAGYGQRFDFKRMQINDVRLTATTQDGQTIEHHLALRKGGLEGALGKVGGKE